ncbi:MAG: cation-translocating P-type ATPase [Planctomycetota bacterium]
MSEASTPLADSAPNPTPVADPNQAKIDLTITAVLAGCVVLIAAVFARFTWTNQDYAEYVAMAAALLLGGPIVVGAFKSLWTGHCSHEDGEACDHDHAKHDHGSHMEELVALAIIASFVLGEYLECAAVAFFMLIASLIEHRTASGALREIEALVRITPTKAMKLNDAGEEIETPASQLKEGDRVVVRPGDNIPADGEVVGGNSTVNQANITGESLPVEKTTGDEVFAGTINESGRMEVKVTRAGEDSTLGKVQGLILQAAQTRPAVVRELSKYTAYYTPVVLMLAFIIWFFTEDAKAAISLLLIACPCALILCAPTAIVAALSSASRLGVYVKSVADLEVVRRVTAFVFDKTGTLTTGKLNVTRMKPVDGIDGAELLRLTASAEQNSNHPVAKAVMAIARKANVDPLHVHHFEEVAGRGVLADTDHGQVLVGRQAFLEERGVHLGHLDTEGTEGSSLLFVARNNEAVGWVALADTLRRGAAESIGELSELDVKQRVMITGDRPGPAERVAQQLHLTGYTAEALPGDKLTLVEQLKEQGHTVAVIGDGVNDGPALAAGHVSLAMGAAGSDVAVDAASIALMNSELNRLPFLVKLSRRTVSVIRQNLIFTGLYIVFMLVLLGLGWLTPLMAAIGHGISSLIVIFNSARLVREGEDVEHADALAGIADAKPKRQITPVKPGGPASVAVPATA